MKTNQNIQKGLYFEKCVSRMAHSQHQKIPFLVSTEFCRQQMFSQIDLSYFVMEVGGPEKRWKMVLLECKSSPFFCQKQRRKHHNTLDFFSRLLGCQVILRYAFSKTKKM